MEDDAEDAEEQTLVRNRSRLVSSNSLISAIDIEEDEEVEEEDGSLCLNSQHPPNIDRHVNNVADFPSDEWGGMSSLEHDEVVMLEAAMFGGITESGYRVPYAPHPYMRNRLDENLGVYARPTPRPPSPSLISQRSIREQQVNTCLQLALVAESLL